MKDLTIQDLTTGEQGLYKYYVNTPDGGTFYFEEKDLAREFIEFYKDYTNKQKNKVPALLKR